MAKPINMPKMGNTVESVIVGEIKIKVGDTINAGDILFTYETDKSTTEYKSEDSGKVQAILMEEGEEVPVLVPVIVLGEDGEDISSFTKSKETTEEEPTEIKEVKKEDNVATKEVLFGGKASPRARSTAANLDVDLSKVGGSGIEGRIQESDVLSFYHADGTLASGISAGGNFEYKELLIQAMAKELGFKIATNIEQKHEACPCEIGSAKPAEAYLAGGGLLAADVSVPEGATRTQFTPVRTAIAKTMMNSLMQAAQLSMGITFDATELIKARGKIKKLAADGKHANSSINDIIIFALSRVLPKHPHLNAQIGADYSDQFEVAHISVAVDTPSGLFVPVVADATNKSLSDITYITKDLITKAQGGSLKPADMQGGTFTISNLGLSGVSFFTPVLNPPQAGILGVGSPIKRLKINDKKEVVEYPEITLSLTMDHRPNDGVAGTLFLKEMKETLENIGSLIK